jgi:hypothetical protein
MEIVSANNFVHNHKRWIQRNKSDEKWGHPVYFSSKDVPIIDSSWMKVAWSKANGGKQFHGFASYKSFYDLCSVYRNLKGTLKKC